VSAAGLQVRPYFHRYSGDALDLCDTLGPFSPGSRVKLDEISKVLALTGKPEGLDVRLGLGDCSGPARMLDLGEALEADVRQALGSGFPKHPLHKIVCIGALFASRTSSVLRLGGKVPEDRKAR
jgi:hypothetical protein